MPDEVTPPSGEDEVRAKYNTADREKLAKEGKALPDGSYPIVDKEDLQNAATLAASGHGNVDAAKALIRKRAKELGVDVASLPGFGKESKSALTVEPNAENGEAVGRALETGTELGDDGRPASEGEVGTQQARRKKRPRHRAVPLMPEVRHFAATGLEIRSQAKTDEIVITGSPIVYGTPYAVRDMFGEFQETMAPGVASDVMANGADVRFLFNHDGLPLARSTSGTLALTENDGSLDFEARLDARQQLANDLAIAIERGDVTQMSCGFIVARDEWDEAEENRTIHQFADLLDVSAVTYPASPTTHIQIAQRMALEMPVESRARLRNLIVEGRAGAVLSAGSKEKVASAIEALHSLYTAGGGDVRDFLSDDQPEAAVAQDSTAGDAPEGQAFLDASGERQVDPGEPVRMSAASLRLQIEARRLRRAA